MELHSELFSQLAVVLGVELRRQGRRGNQVAEHDADLPPLGVGGTELFLTDGV